jgi:carbohydrate-selective porin OprB
MYSQTRPSEERGLQGLSSNLTEPLHRWREAYFELPVSRRLRLKVGKVDANSEFAVIVNGADFSNASFGVSPTLFTMPSYPYGAASANAFVAAASWLNAGVGVYSAPGGALYSVGQAGGHWSRKRSGRLAVGYWSQTAVQSRPEAMPASSGLYVVCEQTVLPRGGQKGMRVFARVSTAEKSVAPASAHAAYGVTWTGFGRREEDSSGFALLDLVPSTSGQPLRSERAFEAYYKISFNKYLALKFDIQHIRRPGGFLDSAPMTVAAFRFLISASTSRGE